MNQSETALGKQNSTAISPDSCIFNKILNNASELGKIICDIIISNKDQNYCTNYNEMIESTNVIINTIKQNIDYFNGPEIFSEDLAKSIYIIDKSYEAYLKSFNFIISSQQQEILNNNLQISINNFAKSIITFSSIIKEISDLLFSKEISQDNIDIINIRIGIESSLFNFAVNVEETTEDPFYKSRFVEIYKCYNKVNKLTNNIIAFESVCGTGKTLCLPIILLCKSLKENMNMPFLLMIEPSPKQIEMIETFYTKILSKYIQVETDPNKIFEIYNEYDKSKKLSKMVLGLISTNLIPQLINQLQKNKSFYSCTRFIIDELHQRPIYYDVLLSQFAELNNKSHIFTQPLNLILMSATISQQILRIFNDDVIVKSLIKKHPFDITEQKPIIEPLIPKINNEIIPNQMITVLENMGKSTINEGHIICFLSGIGQCYKLRSTIISFLKNSEETENQKKIVVLETILRPNETKESYFRRLEEEYLLNESLREGNEYKKEFIYFVPIILSGNADDSLFEIFKNEFPDSLKKINKIICCTPVLETSYNIDNLSVVIDSGLVKENNFDNKTCLSTSIEKQATKESMNQRKGRLGRSMKGLYISIIKNEEDDIHDFKIPPIKRTDLTTNILTLKEIEIDFEKIKNFPSKPNQKNLHFSINSLIRMNAIDSETLKINSFGREVLKYVCFPFISVYDAASIVNFRESFQDNEKNYATFISSLIISIIKMDKLLIDEDNSEKMSRCFSEESDITTIVNAIEIILNSKLTENDQLRDLVESYGFSYTNYLSFINHLQDIVDMHEPGQSVAEYFNKCKDFVNKYESISGIVDLLIPEISKVTPHWKNIHSIRYKYANGAGSFNKSASIVFNADKNLMFENQHQKNAEIRITQRPGWNGIMIPTECYCFNISRNSNSNINFGHLIHRMHKKTKGEIASVECDKMALNPWFNVLLDTYLEGSSLNIKYFTNLVKQQQQQHNNNNNKGQNKSQTIIEKKMFHYSNAGERVFVSFIPCDDNVKQIIKDSINKCLKLMPFSPRSILIFRKDVKSIVEITSIGTEHYETAISTVVHGKLLDKNAIDFCLQNINELAKSDSTIRICALFTRQTCESDFYDTKHLYLINTNRNNWPPLKDTVSKMIDELMVSQKTANKNHLYRKVHPIKSNVLKLFQFPARFIHPALLYHQQSRECILKWFSDHCDYAKIVKVIGHNFLMKYEDILRLQEHLRIDKDRIKQEMNLNYVAIPIQSQVYSKDYLTIRQHPTWLYNKRFKVIIAQKEEKDSIEEFIQTIKDQIKKENQNDKSDEFTETLCCLYICDDPDNPVLTKYPITIYYNDGTTYTNKMCRDCLVDSLRVATESFFNDGKIDQNALNKISIKPPVIPSVECKEINDGLEYWPQIPLGQMISALINNDEQMSDLISAWLQAISEFVVRVAARDQFTFCPDHPDFIFNLKLRGNKVFKCKNPDCKNSYCDYCLSWHDENYICQQKKDGKMLKWEKFCPKCKSPTFKDGGCNHISCPCGCHWCYKCGKGFSTPAKCYNHMTIEHGGCFDYEFDD